MRTDLLTIYLNDHLAGATLAVAVARRVRRANAGEPLADFLGTFLDDVVEEEVLVEDLLRRIGGRADRLKRAGAWLAEKAGRLKLNGALVSYSPLSRVEELEGLILGVRGKRALWGTLRVLQEAGAFEGVDVGALERRAEGHLAELERHRQEALRRAFLAPA